MFVHISIHKPKPGKEEALIESMHRFGAAASTQPGLQQIFALQDPRQGVLVGLAIWDSKDSLMAARPVLAEATKDDDFDDWESEPVTVYHLEAV
jgi:heme-degrading monooxygenase HmoA